MAGMSKQRAAYLALRQRIMEGAYGSGARLTIDSLARELGMSQTPVREAIRQLEAEGLVVYDRHRGARIATVDQTGYAETMVLLALLEGYATAAAAEHVGEEDLAALDALNRDMEAAVRALDVVRFQELNVEFHRTIYRRCPNRYLTEMLDNAWARLNTIRRNIFTFIPGRSAASIDEHRRLIEMLAERAPAVELEMYARQHKLRTLEAFRSWQGKSLPAG